MKKYNILKNFFLVLFILLNIILGSISKVEAATVTTSYSNNTNYNIGYWPGATSATILHGITISSIYKSDVVNTCDGDSVVNTTGANVTCGDTLRFTYSPNAELNTYSYGGSGIHLNSGSTGCPAGIFVSSFITPDGCDERDLTVSIGGDYLRKIYVPLQVMVPSMYLSNTTGMTCGSVIDDGLGIYHQDCDVTKKTGSINPIVNFNSTQAGVWYSKKNDNACYGTNALATVSLPSATIPYSINTVPSPDEIPGSCGTAAKTYAYTDIAYSGTFCATGEAPTINPSFPAASSSVSWTCEGTTCGASVVCTATKTSSPINGSCGTANSVVTSSSPTTNLCSTGTATTPTGSGPWSWSCIGLNGGTTATCFAPKTIIGSCGPAAKTYASASTTFSGALCNNLGIITPAIVTFPITPGTSVSWTCSGTGGQSVGCTAERLAATVVGSCGLSSNMNFLSAPTTNLCSSGTSTSVTGTIGSPWTWSCTGYDTDITNTLCDAERSCMGPGDIEIANGDSYTYFKDGSVEFVDDCVSEPRVCTNGRLSGSYTDISCPSGRGEIIYPRCEAYQNGQLSTGNVTINKEMQWKVSISPAGNYQFSSNLGTSNDNPSYFTKIYQTLGIKTLNVAVTDDTGATGSCTASVNVVLGDQIIIER